MKDIKGFEGLYAITRDGRVWSYPKPLGYYITKGKWLKWRGSGRKYLKVLPDERRDYRRVSLVKGGKILDKYVHRLVAETYIPNPSKLREVNHINGIKYDNRVKNLEWVNHKENARHAFENGLTTRGIKNAQTKLKDKDVLYIRSSYPKKSIKELSITFKVTKSTISSILTRKNWSWLN